MRHRPERACPTIRGIDICTCRRCGASAECAEGTIPLAWSTAFSGGAATMLCERCTRDNVRSIEGKLDEEWWT